MFKNIFFQILISGLLINLNGCSTYSGGEAEGWGNMEQEFATSMIVMIPISIALLPITLPLSLIRQKDKNDFNSNNQAKITGSVVNTKFFVLENTQYSYPAVHYHLGAFTAWIPINRNDMNNNNNQLITTYQPQFEHLINDTITPLGLNSEWKAYEYAPNTWLILDSQCNAIGKDTQNAYMKLMNYDQETLKLEQLCKQN